ncbi:MAG TPA: PA14 domain-containing protein [Anaerolineae bacterium]
MTTHRIPHQEHSGSSKGWSGLAIVLGLLTVIVVALLLWQVYEYTSMPPVPTPISQATVPALTRVPSLELVPAEGAAGASITVVGWGWQPDDDLIVCLDDLGSDTEPPVYAEATVRQDGGFTASFTFPEAVAWLSLPDIPVVVESKTGPEKASAVFRLVLDTPAPSPTSLAMPTATASPTAVPATATPTCVYAMRFVADVTIADDTVIPPGVGFVKTWRIQNSGTCAWPAGTNWVFTGGSQMGGPNAVPVPATSPGETADVSVYLIAPGSPGRYTGYWRLRTATGTELGQRIFVRIVVPAPTPTPAPPTPTPIPPTPTPIPPTPTPTPIPPTSTPTPVIFNWRGEYFSNVALAGMPALVRDDTAIDFDWGMGAPAAGLPADNFSARWTRSLYFESGTYRFYVHSDDGVRLWIDSTLAIDRWHSAAGETYVAEVALSTGNHTIRVEYFEALGTAQIQVWWQRADYYPEWRGEYWSNRSLSGPSTLVRNDAAINFDWGTGTPATTLPADNFSVRWTRTLSLAEGNYRFYAVMDDGLRLIIDGTLIINEWRDGSQREVSKDVWLATGSHDLRVEYYESTGDALVRVSWQRLEGYPEWRGEYWANRNLSGAPLLVRNDRKIDFNWGFSAPDPVLPEDEFSARWTRILDFERGTYRLYARADDGVRVYVDGQRVIDQWHLGGADRTYQADVTLEDGRHTIVVEYYEEHLGAEVHFWYERVFTLSGP